MQGAGRIALRGLDIDACAADADSQHTDFKAFERLIDAAVDQGVAVDVLAVGASAAASLPLLASATGRSGGNLALHTGEYTLIGKRCTCLRSSAVRGVRWVTLYAGL